MALATTPFEAMSGFRPVSEILKHLQEVPELQSLIDAKALAGYVGTHERLLFLQSWVLINAFCA